MRDPIRDHPIDPTTRPLGAGWVVPGLAHWIWGRRERAIHLGGTYASALVLGVFTWGTTLSLAMLLLAFVVHAYSTWDALRRALFPGLGRFAPAMASTFGLGLVVYAPAMVAGLNWAWPGMIPGGGEGYLVDRMAYAHSTPESRDAIWLSPRDRANASRFARVLARGGQEVEWRGGELLINGSHADFNPFPPGRAPERLSLKVPPGSLLVAHSAEADGDQRWSLVSTREVEGRAWARLYPIWRRSLLH